MSFFDDLATLVQPPPVSTFTLTPDQQRAIDLNRQGFTSEAAGQLIGGGSHIEFGQQAAAAAEYQAAQLRQNAGQAQAQAQRQAFDVDRQSQYVASSALATAAASGGGASDPTVVNLIARNAGEFAYRKAVALYNGDDRARLLNMQADAKEFEGKNTELNSDMVGAAQFLQGRNTLLRGMASEASLYARFSGGGPRTGGSQPSGPTDYTG